jgi:hypothetical protein
VGAINIRVRQYEARLSYLSEAHTGKGKSCAKRATESTLVYPEPTCTVCGLPKYLDLFYLRVFLQCLRASQDVYSGLAEVPG